MSEETKPKPKARATRSRSQMEISEALFSALDEGRRVELVTQIATALIKADFNHAELPQKAVTLADSIIAELERTKEKPIGE